ncbi:MAG: 3-oxoacyl-[acyl-carrier-protein] reductase [Candidatus Omnitrophota bacterium]|nr:3-oxoacyl-[acyl-carrier-protein] reductase [Candidatus Omnitrophota bacterium]
MQELKNMTAIITGGSRGIGRACCLAFVREGANVVFTYSKSRKEAQELKSKIEESGAACLAIQADARDYNQCRKVVEDTLAKFGKIDILINNAGITKDRALFMMTLEEWKEVIDTNLGGTFNMARAAITTLMKQKQGCIINMSSVSGITGLPKQTNYSASKAGIIGFSKALAKEVAGLNIRVNAVCPGFIETDMTGTLNENLKKQMLDLIPEKRLGRPEEVAELCVFLASGKAGYITGEAIKIDGGLAI